MRNGIALPAYQAIRENFIFGQIDLMFYNHKLQCCGRKKGSVEFQGCFQSNKKKKNVKEPSSQHGTPVSEGMGDEEPTEAV